jgi:hypothetical protein
VKIKSSSKVYQFLTSTWPLEHLPHALSAVGVNEEEEMGIPTASQPKEGRITNPLYLKGLKRFTTDTELDDERELLTDTIACIINRLKG